MEIYILFVLRHWFLGFVIGCLNITCQLSCSCYIIGFGFVFGCLDILCQLSCGCKYMNIEMWVNAAIIITVSKL